MVEIRNKGDLERWLEGRSREEATAIAVRAALRVMPFLNRTRNFGDFRVSLLQGSLLALDAAIFSLEPMDDDVVRVAAAATHAVSTRAALAAGFADTRAAFVDTRAAYAAYAASATVCAARTVFTALAADAAAAAAAAADVDAAIWISVSHDASVLEIDISPQALLETPFWLEGEPDWATEVWNELKAHLAQSSDTHWEVWTDWYEARRDGLFINWDLQRDRVMIPFQENLWDQGPAVVNARIKEIIAKYAPDAPPHLEASPPQKPGALTYVEADGQILAEPGLGAEAAEGDLVARELHARARSALEALKGDAAQSNDETVLHLHREAASGLRFLGASPKETLPPLLAAIIAALENAQKLDDQRLAEPSEDRREGPLAKRLRGRLDQALGDLGYFVSLNPALARFLEIYRNRTGLPIPDDDARRLLAQAQADGVTNAATVVTVNVVLEGKGEGAREGYANFLRKLTRVGTAVAVGVGGAVGIAKWILANEATLTDHAAKYAPDLTAHLQKLIEFLKTMPLIGL